MANKIFVADLLKYLEHTTYHQYMDIYAKGKFKDDGTRQKTAAWRDKQKEQRELAYKLLRTNGRVDHFLSIVQGTISSELSVLFHYHDDIPFE